MNLLWTALPHQYHRKMSMKEENHPLKQHNVMLSVIRTLAPHLECNLRDGRTVKCSVWMVESPCLNTDAFPWLAVCSVLLFWKFLTPKKRLKPGDYSSLILFSIICIIACDIISRRELFRCECSEACGGSRPVTGGGFALVWCVRRVAKEGNVEREHRFWFLSMQCSCSDP